MRGTTQALLRNCRLIRDHRNSSKLEEMLILRKDQLSQTFIRQSMLTPFIYASYSSIKQKVAVPMVNIDFYVADTFSREVSQIRKTLTQRLSSKVEEYVGRAGTDSLLNPKLHLVLEPAGTAHYYYPNYVKILESVINRLNQTHEKLHG